MAKSFKDRMQQKAVNPTLQFITQPEEAATEPQTAEKQQTEEKLSSASGAPLRAAPARRALSGEEAKSRRLQLLLTPSLYEAVKGRAAEERLSVNELINSILKDAMRK